MDEIQEALERALPDIARRMQNELVLVSPVSTGRLKNSIKVKSTNEGLIIWMVDYGKYIEFGTPPHIITPKEKKALKFKIGGDELIRKKVKHPGTRPNPFIRNTIQNKLREIIIEELANQ
ncbi:MAG: HK97 gp10 family phage protein [Candidatus Heimdallarchaeaceae archaeon]